MDVVVEVCGMRINFHYSDETQQMEEETSPAEMANKEDSNGGSA